MTTIYNPLLDSFTTDEPPVAERPWQVVCERVNANVERAVRKNDKPEAFKWLNVMDMLCAETSAYWRTDGWRVYRGESIAINIRYPRQVILFDTAETPAEPLEMGLGELAYKSGSYATSDGTDTVSII